AFDTYLVTQEPSGRIDENDDISDENLNSTTTYTFHEDGTLEVRVYAVDIAERGPYTLFVSAAAPPESLQTGSTVNGQLAEGDELYEGGYADRYLLSGRAGESITVALRSEEFDTYLILFTTDGTPMENDDLSEDVSDSGVDYVFDADGQVEILVTGYSSEDIGGYELSVESGKGQQTPNGPLEDSSLPGGRGSVEEVLEATNA
ncbi:MAG TPA: hypothetical protein VMW69_07695, partial [Spirochaetia bacterium]|nr:hypothetical protein [Spirochaetia bacterium]